jgi:hypothetical protein
VLKSLEPSAAAPEDAGSPWLSVACEQAGGNCDMIWGVQGGGSDRNIRRMDEDDYYAATARIPDILNDMRAGSGSDPVESPITRGSTLNSRRGEDNSEFLSRGFLGSL